MLKSNPVVIDFEGFKYKQQKFIIKEVAICADYIDSVLFLPPTPLENLPKAEQRAHSWVIEHLHGLQWCSGDYPYTCLPNILRSFAERYPISQFYAKGEEKSAVLEEYLGKPVENLDNLGCPKVENLPGTTPCCENHILTNCNHKHCARRKAVLYYNWLIKYNGHSENFGSEDSVVSMFDALHLVE